MERRFAHEPRLKRLCGAGTMSPRPRRVLSALCWALLLVVYVAAPRTLHSVWEFLAWAAPIFFIFCAIEYLRNLGKKWDRTHRPHPEVTEYPSIRCRFAPGNDPTDDRRWCFTHNKFECWSDFQDHYSNPWKKD